MSSRKAGGKVKDQRGVDSSGLRLSAEFEDKAVATGASRIAGIDEAGRGPLAGPVVAAAVILDLSVELPSLNDSKLLDAKTREELFLLISEKSISVGVGIVGPEEIDRINILQATRTAMKSAVQTISPLPDYLLIDGPINLDLSIPQQPIIKGDRQSLSIAAASIIAKVTRDRIMIDLHKEFPQYGFSSHKGYSTRIHREAIRKHGPCRAHRRCFRGVLLPEQANLFEKP